MRAALLLACLALPACVAGEAVMQETSRSLARTAVNGAARQYLPGVTVTPFTDCIINNAQTGELLQLAQSASQGANGVTQAWPVVQTVMQRPEAMQCLTGQLSAGQMIQVGGFLL
ncbi:succinate dehydrogenase [Pseudogemmobacter faecipullorum]|uniref:Succinate dehydrogenase n=1 Tax=Pseudogemmobacter faecipullorum TaxID=2755041 RepID=A0ABS8CH67_9RHOB|nr:succinate dehydrogenase [Pseudogemmobacter faecipullorum]MCB5408699.1 succinate dehydrogenase [Pseudogemmobacter faecipullorum]